MMIRFGIHADSAMVDKIWGIFVEIESLHRQLGGMGTSYMLSRIGGDAVISARPWAFPEPEE